MNYFSKPKKLNFQTKNKSLNIVSFDVPYPPNYGGVIDVYYKLKKLSELGVDIYLHTFEYGRGKQKELEKYCKEVHYYARKKSAFHLISPCPFIVKSRSNKLLTEKLLENNFPILFEGLHTTDSLIENNFSGRKIFVRTHNIEHNYYSGLENSESRLSKKIFFKTEAKKLEKYEAILKKATHILTISPFEHLHFKKRYGNSAVYTPVFYNQDITTPKETKDQYTLWHGDLRVSDNQQSALFVISAFANLKHKLIIASSFKSKLVLDAVRKYKNVEFVDISNQCILDKLLCEAHIHALYTFQKTGIKLRLLNVLTKGKFVIANSKMIEDTQLENTCYLANSLKEYQQKIEELSEKTFNESCYLVRKEALQNFNPEETAKKIIELL